MIPTLLRGAEFARAVEAPLRDDGCPAPLRFEGEPRPDLRAWAADQLPLSRAARERLPALQDWRSLLAGVFLDEAFQAFLTEMGLSDLSDLGRALEARREPLWRRPRRGTPVIPVPSAGLSFLPDAAEPPAEGPAAVVLIPLSPFFDLVALEEPNAYRAVGRDPQLLHALSDPVHRCRLDLAAAYGELETGAAPMAQLFVDCGQGFAEGDSAYLAIVGGQLDCSLLIESRRPIVQLRFDPCDRPCRFDIARFRVTPLPGRDAGAISAERLARAPGARSREREAGPLSRRAAPVGAGLPHVILISRGPVDGNGSHIARIADGLTARGHAVSVLAEEHGEAAAAFGGATLATYSLGEVQDGLPEGLVAAAGSPGAIVHAWTPRESVRHLTLRLREQTGCRYVVHLEDEEETAAAGSLERSWADLARPGALRAEAADPSGLSRPGRDFLAGAAGVTVSVDGLRQFAPDGIPTHLLEPGIDFGELGAAPDEAELARMRRDLFIAPGATVLLHAGDMQEANRREVFSLYTAVTLLRRRGRDVALVRIGRDIGPGLDLSFDSLRRNGVVPLGQLSRAELMRALPLAEIFVQPGATDGYNRFRFPHWAPEALAAGRPVVLPACNLGLRLRDGVDARLLQTGDGLEIARVVEELMAEPDRMAAIGRAGQAFARTLSWEASLDGLQAFYRSLP